VGLFSPIYGILGLMLILVVGLLLLISVRAIAAPAPTN
jgi:hypothetical protein